MIATNGVVGSNRCTVSERYSWLVVCSIFWFLLHATPATSIQETPEAKYFSYRFGEPLHRRHALIQALIASLRTSICSARCPYRL